MTGTGPTEPAESGGHGAGAGLTRPARPREPVPLWRWAVWMPTLGTALFVFYVLLTPVWLSLRALAWAAEFRARRRRGNPR